MLFNSLEFAIFLPIVFLLYWFVFDYAFKHSRHQLMLQNLFVVVVSYIFYGWWDWRFLFLIALTSFLSWGSGLLMEKDGKYKKVFVVVNVFVNLLILGVFKYYDFFVTSFAQMFGANPDGLLLRIILPVGISFYTFQALSYSIDVYRGRIEPTKDIVAFFAYVSFFPQLVAGPIERATNLLPQFQKKRTFDYDQAVDGMRQILWGLFKKLVVADNCAIYVDKVFDAYQTYSASTLLLAAVLFTFQIYGDFSGYSDIAIGTSKLFGIRLMRNFNVPYFSRNIAEFWKRWHISLNTWFVDYVYIPLGGDGRGLSPRTISPKGERARKMWLQIRNTFIIFLLSGLWHGANWTYVCWGLYHALLFIPLIFLNRAKAFNNSVATWRDLPRMVLVFMLVVIGWIIFRAESITAAWCYITSTINLSLIDMPLYIVGLKKTLLMVVLLLFVEWCTRTYEHNFNLSKIPLWGRVCVYYGLILIILLFKASSQSFIYFQF